MKKIVVTFIGILYLILGIQILKAEGQTYCNPINLGYPLSPGQPFNHNITDPSIVLYKNNYYLFATNAGGYWHSGDLLSWKFISSSRLPLEKQGPVALVIGDWLYFATSMSDTIYRTNDPVGGKWEPYNTSLLLSLINDFTLFADTDGKVYCYYGCSNNDGVMSRELDPNNGLNPVGVPVVCRKANPILTIRNKSKDISKIENSPSVKGSWMNKYNGKYYYQCAEQNTDFGYYSDAVYVSDKPTGPFVYAENNPFSFRPDGFASGVGNGSTFADKYGNWWHIATLGSYSDKDSQSRLGLFPAGFDKDAILFTRTDFGDYPITMPKGKYSDLDKLYPEWSLISFRKLAQSSSTKSVNPTASAFDENMGTYWNAQTGNKGEWLSVDLGSIYTVNAIQVNFPEIIDRTKSANPLIPRQFIIEYSTDYKNWSKLSDKSSNTEDLLHYYETLPNPVQARYLKITNYQSKGNFAISGFRIFGIGTDKKPKKVDEFRAVRDYREKEFTKLYWKKEENIVGYNIRYGIEKDKLYHSYQVYKSTPLKIRCPDKKKTYWFQIDAFNENGVTPGKAQLSY
jgi:hypothetical protein